MSLDKISAQKACRLPVVKRLYEHIKKELLKERLLVEEKYAPYVDFVFALIDLCDYEADVSDDEEEEITLSSSEEAVIDEEAEEETSEEIEEESDESEEGEISESSEEEESVEKPKSKKRK